MRRNHALTKIGRPVSELALTTKGKEKGKGRAEAREGKDVAVCRVTRGKVKLDALLPEGHTRAWQCKDVPLICQRLHVDPLDTGYPVG